MILLWKQQQKKVRDLHTLFLYAKYTSNGTKTNKNRNLSIIYH
jgi:hypothetical protein